ncbi:MAG: glycosyltransferase [Syntrophobacteraceae bacterium]
MKKIRVLQLGSPTGLYGAERWILALIKHLDPEEVESIVAVIKDDPSLEAPLCREAEKLGFRSHVIEARGRVNLSAVHALRKYIQQDRIQVLHTHGYKTDLVGLLSTRGTNCRIVSTPHGWTKQADFKLMCYEVLDRCAFPFFDSVVPLSDELFKNLRGIPWLNSKLCLIRNGVDIAEIESVKHAAGEVMKFRNGGNFIIGYIGRLVPPKGIDTLLNSVARLSFENWRLVIIGEGESQSALERLAKDLRISDKVCFFGFREDRIAFLRGFDVFVLPSRSEGTPRSVMEAMATGVPVIASKIQGCQVLIEDGQNGLLCEVDDSEGFTAKIEHVLKDSNLRKELADSARDRVNRFFSAQTMATAYTRLYSNLIDDCVARAHD